MNIDQNSLQKDNIYLLFCDILIIIFKISQSPKQLTTLHEHPDEKPAPAEFGPTEV